MSKTSTLEERFLTFRAYNPQKQQPITIRPCEDHSGRIWTGQGQYGYFSLLTEKERNELVYVVNPDTGVVIEDGKVIDLENPVDKENLPWMLRHPYIDKQRQAHPSRGVVFYIDNPKQDAEIRVSSTELIDEARYKIRQVSADKRILVARFLGLDSAKSMSADQVTDYLLHRANETPQTVLTALKSEDGDKLVKATIFLKKAVKWQVIEKGGDGIYRFGGEKGTALGHDEASSVDFLLNPANAELTKIIKAKLIEITKEEEV